MQTRFFCLQIGMELQQDSRNHQSFVSLTAARYANIGSCPQSVAASCSAPAESLRVVCCPISVRHPDFWLEAMNSLSKVVIRASEISCPKTEGEVCSHRTSQIHGRTCGSSYGKVSHRLTPQTNSCRPFNKMASRLAGRCH